MEHFLQSEWIDHEVGNLVLPARAVHFWQIRPSVLFGGYLIPAELVRYERIANEAVKMSYGSVQGGIRRIAAFYMGCPPQEVEIRRERRGKPYVRGAPEFNLSHTEDVILAAFSSSPLGLDIESAHRRVDAESVARKFFSPEEIRRLEMSDSTTRSLMFLRYWVCKEAIVKLSGDGIYHGLRHARVDLMRVDLTTGGRSRGAYRGREVWLQEFRPSQNVVAALASWDPLEAKGFFRI